MQTGLQLITNLYESTEFLADLNTVPEPQALLLMAMGLLGLTFGRRKFGVK